MDRDGVLAKLLEDLSACEEYLKKEARLDLVMRILEELMDMLEEARKMDLNVEDIEERIRILYHRASTLMALHEKEVRR